MTVPPIAALPVTSMQVPFSLASPSSNTLLKAFGNHYSGAVVESGLAEALSAGEAISPIAVEELTLSMAETASARYASVASSWSALQKRIEGGERLSFTEAFALQSEIAYVESIISPAVNAGKIVRAARAADMGWEDPGVQEMVDDLSAQATCRDTTTALRVALQLVGVADVDTLLALDVELRTALPVHGMAIDAALCAAKGIAATNALFLQSMDIDDSDVIGQLLEVGALPPPAPEPHILRIIARLGEDGRIEHGVETPDGEQVLPSVRFLPTSFAINEWRTSSDVEVDGSSIGKIRVRRLADGRIELGFRSVGGDAIAPDIRYLPVDLPEGVWLRSSEIEVPPAPASLE